MNFQISKLSLLVVKLLNNFITKINLNIYKYKSNKNKFTEPIIILLFFINPSLS